MLSFISYLRAEYPLVFRSETVSLFL
jgi:hypothetical protein